MNIRQKSFSYITVRNRLILVFICAMFGGMLLLGGVLSAFMYRNIQKSTYENIGLTVSTTANSLEQSLVLVQNTALELAASNAVSNWMRDEGYYNEEDNRYFLRREELKNEMLRIISYSNAKKLNLISYATIYANDKMIEWAYIKQIGFNTIRQESEQAYQNILKNEEEYIYSFPIYISNNTFFHVRKLKSDFDGSQQLAIMIATEESMIRKKYQDMIKGIGDIAYLIDDQQRIISSNIEADIGTVIESGLDNVIKGGVRELTYQGIEYHVTSKDLTETGKRFIYLYPKSKIAEQVIDGMKPYIAITFTIMVFSLAFGLYFSIRSTEFINELASAMKSVKDKNYDVQMKKYNDPQINLLSDTFNEMTTEIKELIKNKYESRLLLREMQISFLQHQMNPHFLFNVLLTIQIKAKRSSDESIYKMTAALSALLRASIYTDKNTIIAVRQELEYVEFYLYLQKMRFTDRLTYRINIEDQNILNNKIPKFIIEPIVENAVIHGIESLDRDCVLTIDVYRDDDLFILVSDNGRGFDVHKYFSQDSTDGDETQEKIGIKNVDLRIKHIYGERYGLTVQSRINEGTQVQIRIPYMGEEEDV